MKRKLCYVIASLFIVLLTGADAFCVDVTGLWIGTTDVGQTSSPNTFVFYQNGTDLLGAQIDGTGANCILEGTVIGNQISFHSDCPTINYSSDATGTTDGKTMSGSFLDSQSTSGTFTAQKFEVPLTRGTVIETPPVVTVHGKSATVFMQKFRSVNVAKPRRLGSSYASVLKATVQYELTIKGSADRRKIISKRNSITARNLKPGAYVTSYRVLAIRNGKKLFASARSPLGTFTIF
jgi:hypothetical protein